MIVNNHLPPGTPFKPEKEVFFVLVVNGIDQEIFSNKEEAIEMSSIYKRHLTKIYKFIPEEVNF